MEDEDDFEAMLAMEAEMDDEIYDLDEIDGVPAPEAAAKPPASSSSSSAAQDAPSSSISSSSPSSSSTRKRSNIIDPPSSSSNGESSSIRHAPPPFSASSSTAQSKRPRREENSVSSLSNVFGASESAPSSSSSSRKPAASSRTANSITVDDNGDDVEEIIPEVPASKPRDIYTDGQVSKLPFIGQCIPVSNNQGGMVWVAMDDEFSSAGEYIGSGGKGPWKPQQSRMNSLRISLQSQPIEELLEEVERKRSASMLERAEREEQRQKLKQREQLARAQQMEYDAAEEGADGDDVMEVDSHSKQTKPKREKDLWVDKYAPKRFFDLVSDEKTNREVLSWLKSWDPIVFGAPSSSSASSSVIAAPAAPSAPSLFSPQRQKQKEEPIKPDPQQQQQTLGPKQKVVLLCGPPGLGKTTLAHILANTAGYHPVEINASEDRSRKILIERIRDSTQMQSVFNADRRPNCLILDEIDGAMNGREGKGAIDALVSIATGKPLAEESSSSSSSVSSALNFEKSKGKGAAGGAAAGLKLNRPVICICNDLYAPALRELRKVALVFHFRHPSSASSADQIINRLMSISKKEGLKVERNTIASLCDLAEYDLRSCLNTLQFVHRQATNIHKKSNSNSNSFSALPSGGTVVDAETVRKCCVGHKDINKSLFEIWNNIFSASKSHKSNNLKASSAHTSSSKRVYENVAGHPDMDRILEGCFESFLNLRYTDPTLSQTLACAEWSIFNDHLERLKSVHQNYSLLKYKAFGSVRYHLTAGAAMASGSRPPIQFPRIEYQAKVETQQRQHIATTFLNGLKASVRSSFTTQHVMLDAAFFLSLILSPKIKPSAVQLLSERDKKQLVSLLEMHDTYGITYRMVRTDSLSQVSIATLFKQVQQNMIDRYNRAKKEFVKWDPATHNQERMCFEPALELIGLFKDSNPELWTQLDKQISVPIKGYIASQMSLNSIRSLHNREKDRQAVGKVVAPHLQHLKMEAQQQHELLQQGSGGKVRATHKTEYQVIFKFNEGFTNAVKRPTTIKHWMRAMSWMQSSFSLFPTSLPNDEKTLRELEESSEPLTVFSVQYPFFNSDCLSHIRSLFYFSYRREFETIPPSHTYSSDVGFGCVHRTGQMLLAQTLLFHHMGRGFRLSADIPPPQEYYDILSCFRDTSDAPFSIHKICQIGMMFDIQPGNWLQPSLISHVIKKLVTVHQWPPNLCVYVTDHATIYKDAVQRCISEYNASQSDRQQKKATVSSKKEQSSDSDQTAILALVPTRLGLGSCINPSYIPSLMEILRLPQCVGIVGGKPRHSLYFVGTQGDKTLLYLDPHYCQPALLSVSKPSASSSSSSPASPSSSPSPSYAIEPTCHFPLPLRMDASQLDPSMSIGFYLQSLEDLNVLKQRLAKLNSKHGAMAIVQIEDCEPSFDDEDFSYEEDEAEEEGEAKSSAKEEEGFEVISGREK